MTSSRSIQVAVIGGGPGGYSAAFAAADLGLEVAIITEEPVLGGVCLQRGCIPSKTLLHVAEVVRLARQAEQWGVVFGPPAIDLAKLRQHKERVIARMTDGLSYLARQRGIEVIHGRARFEDGQRLSVETPGGSRELVMFQHAVIATGSRAHIPPS